MNTNGMLPGFYEVVLINSRNPSYVGSSENVNRSVVSGFLRPRGLQPTRSLCPRNSPGKNTGVGCHALFQGILLTQRSNLGLLHCRQILCHLSCQGSLSHVVFIHCTETEINRGTEMCSLAYHGCDKVCNEYMGKTFWNTKSRNSSSLGNVGSVLGRK